MPFLKKPTTIHLTVKADAGHLHLTSQPVPGGIPHSLLTALEKQSIPIIAYDIGNLFWCDPCSGKEFKISVLFIHETISEIQRKLAS